jgi:hypothetical protein
VAILINEPRESRSCMSRFKVILRSKMRSIAHRPISIESQWFSKKGDLVWILLQKERFPARR